MKRNVKLHDEAPASHPQQLSLVVTTMWQAQVISFGSHLAACVAGHQWGRALHILSERLGICL